MNKAADKKFRHKDMHLVSIYLKIHDKKSLTADDLAYLAKYNPECFHKTCDRLLDRMPESKHLLPPAKKSGAPAAPVNQVKSSSGFEATADGLLQSSQVIRSFLEKMRTMENDDVTAVQHVDLDQVKDLVGNLYMEIMFPDAYTTAYFKMYDSDPKSTFNQRA